MPGLFKRLVTEEQRRDLARALAEEYPAVFGCLPKSDGPKRREVLTQIVRLVEIERYEARCEVCRRLDSIERTIEEMREGVEE